MLSRTGSLGQKGTVLLNMAALCLVLPAGDIFQVPSKAHYMLASYLVLEIKSNTAFINYRMLQLSRTVEGKRLFMS